MFVELYLLANFIDQYESIHHINALDYIHSLVFINLNEKKTSLIH